MKSINTLSFILLVILLLASASGTTFLIMTDVWFSAWLCGIFCIALAIVLYIGVMRQTRNLYEFIHSHRNTAMKEIPVAKSSSVDLTNEIEQLLESYRKEIFNETTQQKYYEILLDQVNIGVLASTPEGKILWTNRTADRLIGSHVNTPDEWLKIPSGTSRVVQAEKHGMTQDLLIGNTHFKQENGTQILFTLRDIHHVLEAQQIESWRTLTRVLTHEIMNSLSPILSLSETLANPLPIIEENPKYKENMQQALLAIHRRSKGLLDFVENYRKLTRLPEPQFSAINADELFNELQRLVCESGTTKAQPKVTFEQPYKGFIFHADRGQLEQVLINLIKNACEASIHISDDGEINCTDIEVKLSRNLNNDEVCISVQDHGIGMSAEVQERIFVPFYTTKSEGSGIGLSLCKQIVHLHHGHMLVRSVQGKGTCVTVCIPRKEIQTSTSVTPQI